jgi:cell wall assembly regulator SMI1
MQFNLLNSGKKITQEKLSALEEKLQVVFPTDYKSFLLKKNGGSPTLSTIKFTGVDGFSNSTIIKQFFSVEGMPAFNLEINTNFYTRSGRIPKNVIPIAEDIASNLICMDVSNTSNGTIYFWDHELELDKEDYGNLAPISRSFSEFINMLHQES